MRHLDDGLLRRMMDEPMAISDSDRRHYTSCSQCHGRYTSIRGDANAVEAMLSVTGSMTSAQAALAHVHNHIDAESIRGRRSHSRLVKLVLTLCTPGRGPLVASAGALTLIAALIWTPAGSLAQDFVTIFQPKQVVALPVTGNDIQTLRGLTKFGTFHGPRNVAHFQAADRSAAAKASGLTVLLPHSLPSDITGSPRFDVVPGSTASFTFSASKASAASRNQGKPAPAMPANIDGSSIVVSTGNAVTVTYGFAGHAIPQLVVGEMRAPTVRSSGVSLKELENYLLAMPGVSHQLAIQIKAINDPTSTLPIPILVDRESATRVTIAGVQGLAVGDSTGIGSGVVWQKDGIIYGVAGPESVDEVVTIAQSLQ